MSKYKLYILLGMILMGSSLILILDTQGARAKEQSLAASYQTGVEPQCSQPTCVGACRMEMMVWGDDSNAVLSNYFNNLKTLAGCGASEMEQLLSTTFDLVSEVAAVETGAFLNCGQIQAGVDYSDCDPDCETNPCLYAPNLRTSITNTDPLVDGLIKVTLRNSNGPGGVLDPTAITGGIKLYAKVLMEDWNEAIPFAKLERASLGMPLFGWATIPSRTCQDDTSYCAALNTLANAPLTREFSIPFEGLYALENLITAQHHIDIAPGDGYVALIEDGDSVSLQAGLIGIKYVRVDDDWDGTWEYDSVEQWDSLEGEYSASNTECQSWCWFEDKVNRDTFLMVLDGPCEKMILGDYTLEVDSPLDHDKDIRDNKDTIVNSLGSLPTGCADLDTAITEATLDRGVYPLAFANEYIKYYKVSVPEGTSLLEVILEGQSDDANDDLSLLLSHETYPTTTRNSILSYDFSADDDPGYPDKLRIPVPEPGDWIIEVYHSGPVTYTGNFTLTINKETASPTVIQITEGQYALQFPINQTSQVFRLDYPGQLEEMKVSFQPPSIGPFRNLGYKIYMCPQFTPKISYIHTYFPGYVCDGRVAFDGQGLFGWPINAAVTIPGAQSFYILVERDSGISTGDYALDVTFTWPAGVGLETEPNDDCANATSWPQEDMGIPRRGYFDNPGASGDTDSYSLLYDNTGASFEMETYLASVPGNILPDLKIFKLVGQDYQPVAADTSAPLGGSPKLRFPFFYGTQYCIQVSSRDLTENPSDPYSLYFQRAGASSEEQPEVEPNDDSNTANVWQEINVAIRGRLTPSNDKDFFKWKAPATGIYFVSIATTPTIPLHELLVFQEYGLSADNTPIISMIANGSNFDETAPVGLYFFATADIWYYFELMTQEYASSWYKLTLQAMDDLGPTCYGAPNLRLGQVRLSDSGLTNSLTSQLVSGDTDCFRLVTSDGGNLTLSLTQSPAGITPSVEIFRYNPKAFDFDHRFDTPVLLAQSTLAAGNGLNGEYTVGFTSQDIPGLEYPFPGYIENTGYCACISATTGSQDSGSQDGDGSTDGSRSGDQMESEPNETTGQASNWDPTSPIQGSLNTEGDVDYYQFTAAQSGIYKITLSNLPANIAPKLYMYRSNASMVYMKSDTQPGDSIVLEIDADQGETFFIKIMSYNSLAISDQYYVLSAEIIPDPMEPNNTQETASAWDAFNTSIQGYFHDRLSGQSDYYVFTVPQSAGSVLLNVNLSDVPANVQAKLYLKLANGTQVASNMGSTAGQPISIMIDANPGETYYVSVMPYSHQQVSSTPYTLSVTTIPDPYEPNDNIETASLWDYTAGPIQGYFVDRRTGPGDYYKFTAPVSQAPVSGPVSMTIQLENVPANMTPRLDIYDGSNRLIKIKTGTHFGESLSLTFDATPGALYYVRVMSGTPLVVSTQPYSLAMVGFGP